MSSFSRFGLLIALATTALLAGCKHRQQDTDQSNGERKPPSGSTLAIAGRMLDGADQATIHTYLQTVQDVKPKKFSVQWSPDTVPVSRDEAMRSLQSINEDGSLYTFASSEPVVGRLAPGRILWIWDVTIRRIVSVSNLGDVTIVRTKPVALTQALPEADIEFETAPNFANAYGGLRPHSLKQLPAQKTSAVLRQPIFRLASLNIDDPPQPKPGEQPAEQDPAPSDEDDTDYGLVAATQDGYNGRVGGFEYSMEYKGSPSRLSYEFEARKEEEKGGSGENNEIHRDQRDEYFELVKEQREAEHEERILAARIADLDQQLNAAQNKAVAAAKGDASFNAIIIQLKGDKIAAYKESNKYKDEAAAVEANTTKLAAAGALAKKVFYIISDNLDVRFRSKVDLDRCAFSGNIHTAGGSLTQFAAHFKDMKGNVELEFAGRLGQGGNAAASVPVVNVPVVMNIPVPVEGIPLVVQFATNFMVKLFLAGNHATRSEEHTSELQ